MGLFFWLLSGFIFSCAMVVLIAWLDDKSEVEISWFIVTMVLLGTAFGWFTVMMSIVMGIMLGLEDKRVQAWVSKPLKTFKIKDKE